jgi:hypothetical protein
VPSEQPVRYNELIDQHFSKSAWINFLFIDFD